eukprot:CAMPEP_0116922092 /NCGR_PEP_ID=MMETSP0467-20121206/22044_1 /TAXON_ID=283647 /ORGANISM="Mesodinium pulex, Strain SPMC105" /LENGTH=315 /DNA_ID=CAMNT_0004600333 /DNA_START=106 /DNA_END=1053 /DNA_ORIENTATION=+
MPVSDKKRAYGAKLNSLVEDVENSILIVSADNVGSKQFQAIRKALRGFGELMMGKNTTIRKILKDFLAVNPDHPIEALLPSVAGNVGLLFTKQISKARDVLEEFVVPAPARAGALAPIDVYVEPGPTGCDPGQTGWFQALAIATKIARGQIEITTRTQVVVAGEKVGESQAALLQKLDVRPFSYGLECHKIYSEGSVFDAAVLDLSPADLIGKLHKGIRVVAAISREVGYPTLASLPHSINSAVKKVLAVAIQTEFSFPLADEVVEFLKNPGAFAAASGGAAAADEAEPEPEAEESESAGGAGGLFGDEEDSDDW